MVLGGVLALGLPVLMNLLSPQETGATQADHMGSYGPAFYQSYDASGQFTYEFDGEQLFSVDLKTKEAVWRLPEFGNFAHFDPQHGLASIAAIQIHLDALIKRSNRTRATNVPPKVTVLPKYRVELGQPNILICIVDNIFPPVISITWLHNGQTVTKGVAQSGFYAQPDHLFRKFHYLTFVPSAEDVYDCKVEHWGLEEPLLKHWEPNMRTSLPDTTETLIYVLGLAVGLLGFLVGTIFIISGACLSSDPKCRRPQESEQRKVTALLREEDCGMHPVDSSEAADSPCIFSATSTKNILSVLASKGVSLYPIGLLLASVFLAGICGTPAISNSHP